MERKEVVERFGLQPEDCGNRFRGWWIVHEVESEEEVGGASVGDLCVKTRDGGSNPIDPDACRYPNFVGTSEDGFDRTYRYYYYRPLNTQPHPQEGGEDE